ncbi:type IV pilus assembly protein PilE [Acinetobacter calcoaceticus]|uniref:Type IV pilus assembly protein PilE n=1 Tax=Acinetobacter calcoaceticus TaxID=471 RepID=A0A4R1Y3R4_ACICA|nr:type IV pilus assembly protein PilE [Acinetobacter calcoaceticus]
MKKNLALGMLQISPLAIRRGFSLMELMVVVCLMGILMSLAYPAYQQYKVRANRADVQAYMLQIAGRLQQFKALRGDFTQVHLQDIGVSEHYPETATSYYNLKLSSDAQQWKLIATPITDTMQQDNGAVVLNSHGHSCWVEGIICTVNNASSWHVR